jgi:nicotinamide mononucleotide (NMN) deamidase PncC
MLKLMQAEAMCLVVNSCSGGHAAIVKFVADVADVMAATVTYTQKRRFRILKITNLEMTKTC